MSEKTTQTRMEIMWGSPILDEGFTAYPNIIMRNMKKLNVTNAEYVLICITLTFKHDTRDPFPTYETLAEILGVTAAQVKKLVASLKKKKLIRVGKRKAVDSKKYESNVYDFKPLIDACLALMGEKPLPESAQQSEVKWSDEKPELPEVAMEKSEPGLLEVAMEQLPEVATERLPEVATKRKREKENIKMEGRKGAPALNVHNPSNDSSNEKTLIDKELDRENRDFELFREFCKDRKIDGSEGYELWKIWKYQYPEAPVSATLATLRELIGEQLTATSDDYRMNIRSVIGLFHHRMRNWKSILVADKFFDENGGWSINEVETTIEVPDPILYPKNNHNDLESRRKALDAFYEQDTESELPY